MQTARLKSRIPQYGVVGGAIGGISQLQLLPFPLQRNCIYRSNNFSHIEPPRQCCLHKHRCARSWTHGRIFPKMFNVDNDPLKLTELPCPAAPLKAAHRLFSGLTFHSFLLSGRTLKAIRGSQTCVSLTLRHYRLSLGQECLSCPHAVASLSLCCEWGLHGVPACASAGIRTENGSQPGFSSTGYPDMETVPQLAVSLLFACFPELGTPCLIHHQSLRRSHTATSYTVLGPEQSRKECPRKKD